MVKSAHRVYALTANVARKHPAEPVPPEAHCLVAQINAALKKQVLDVPQAKREPDVHHHDEADYLG